MYSIVEAFKANVLINMWIFFLFQSNIYDQALFVGVIEFVGK